MSALFIIFGLYTLFVNDVFGGQKNLINDTSLYSSDSNLDNINII